MKNKILCLATAVTILASISATSVFASVVSSDNFNTSEFSEVTKAVNTVIEHPFEGTGSTSWQSSFSTTYSQPSYKVTINNTGTSDVTVWVRKNNGNGDIQTSFVVPAGKTIISDIMTTNNFWNFPGTRYVVINSNDGNAFQGDIVVKVASESSEL